MKRESIKLITKLLEKEIADNEDLRKEIKTGSYSKEQKEKLTKEVSLKITNYKEALKDLKKEKNSD